MKISILLGRTERNCGERAYLDNYYWIADHKIDHRAREATLNQERTSAKGGDLQTLIRSRYDKQPVIISQATRRSAGGSKSQEIGAQVHKP